MMKNKLILFITIISLLSCKAQIAPLYKADPDLPEGTYYKDLNNDLNKFEGTWKWENGNNSFTIVLEKKLQVYDDTSNFYEDMLIGEYKYVENGVEIVNSLARLQDITIIGFSHYLTGVRIMHKNHPPHKCESCTNEERRVSVYIRDPEIPLMGMQIILRHIVENNVEKLEGHVMGTGSYVSTLENPESPRINFGDYVFIKQ